ncbi:response regulator [Bradyrhizobium tropiciagri]|nr:response regulator [Bradyrhizobium tropiciagri]
MPLLSRLLLLMAVALLPAIAIQAYNEFDLRRTRRIEVQNQALNLAELAGAEQRQIIQGIHQVLIALSELEPIKARDGRSCNAYMAAIKQRFPAFLTLVVTDLNGETFCDPHNNSKPVNVSDRAYFATALKTGAFTVGEFSLGLSSGRTAVQFALPFYENDEQMGGLIIATLSLDWLADYIAKTRALPGAAIAIMDRHGTYLARYPDNARFVGRKASADNYPMLDRGTADIVDRDGVERVVGYARLQEDFGGFLVTVGLDKARAFTEIESRTRRGVLMIMLSTALVLMLTSLGARRFIYRPLEQLVDVANQWRLGDLTRRANVSGTSEIARVAGAFNAMADALEYRDQELSEAKETAENAAAQIKVIFESTNDSVLIVDRSWRIRYLNGSALTQIAEGRDLIGLSLTEAFSTAADMEIVRQIRDAMSTQRSAFVEVFCAQLNGWYAINAFPSSQGLAIFFRDITDHKHALEARRLMEEQLHQSQRMESVGQLTGGVAHDFNNLLMVISANLELIDSVADIDRIRHYAAAARRATDRGARLTGQLLAFSRRQALNPKLIDASQLIVEFQGLIRQAVGDGCEVELQLDEQLWLCHVDPALLETALLNLALNARDAMPDGGKLRIETRNVVADEETVGGCAPGSYVRLSVADVGCGMPPDVLDRVFDPFFTTKEVGKGTGLGLSMVYGFVRQSGGHIAIQSKPGAGTIVVLYLPASAETNDADDDAITVPSIPTGSERVLVVDDNEELLRVTSSMLKMFGYQVFCAPNGTEALQLLHSDQQFDLLFSDIVMPNGINGIELAREATRLRNGMKILLTSGYADEALQRHQAVGEFPIIDKPFGLADLAQRIRSILREA